MCRTKEANFQKSIFLCACPRLHPMSASDWRQPPKSWAWVYALPSHHSSASVLHDRLWCDTLLCRGTSYGQSLSDARCPRVAGVVWLPDSIGRFTRRYYSKKAGYTGMKLICSLFITFLKIGAFTFGGGYAMIALLENEFVEKKKWLEKSEFLDMVAVAESTPGPVAINSATYIGYKIAGFAGATMSTLAVSIPSFFVIYGISLFFDQFLSLRWVSCAFRGIQVCVIYLILTAGLKSIDKNTLNLTILTLVVASMLCCSITAVSFSSVFYILICGAVGLVVFFLRKSGKEMGKRHDIPASLSELFDDRCLVFRRRLWNGFAGTRNGAFQRLADRERVSEFYCRI